MREKCTCLDGNLEGECLGEMTGMDKAVCMKAMRSAISMGDNPVYKKPLPPPPEAYVIIYKKPAP